MRGIQFLRRFLFTAMAIIVSAGLARSDTIVLKNGRRITAFQVVEEKDKVAYETSAGRLSLPKSIVDHVEYGGAVPPDFGKKSPVELTLAPKTGVTLGDDEITRATVHDGSIDRAYIARLENDARGGEGRALERVVRAHHAAAQFEVARNNYEEAIAQERSALVFAPQQPTLLVEIAYLHLRRSEYKAALEYLDRAKRVAPDSPDVFKLSGWAYYRLNKITQAVAEWKRALALSPDAEVQAALDKAQRDEEAEEKFKENVSTHFTLLYHGGAEPGLARDILRTLEAHFGAIESTLNFTPPEPISVILYTEQAFADITRAPSWVGALNDGRIRVPVQGLTSVPAELSRVLKHELTHSFIQQKTRGHCPTWLQEGLAQWMEGKRSGENAYALVKISEESGPAPLGALEGSWMNLPTDAARYAYAWALAVVEYLVQVNSMRDVERLLDGLINGSTETACREVLRMDYNDIAQATVVYLRRNYVR
jgi:tetratricopeptide (TPR) repeat protein